jgi:hypothetical protein
METFNVHDWKLATSDLLLAGGSQAQMLADINVTFSALNYAL